MSIEKAELSLRRFRRSIGSILYVSTVDISLPEGPSVNEREFIFEMMEVLDEDVHFVVPEPSLASDAHKLKRHSTMIPKSGRGIRGWLRHQYRLYKAAKQSRDLRKVGLLVFRLQFLPVAAFLLATRVPCPYAIKTVGVGITGGYRTEGSWLRRVVGIPHDVLVARLLRGALVIDTITEEMAEAHARRFNLQPSRILVVPNGVNVDHFRPMDRDRARAECGLDDWEQLIGYVGAKAHVRGGWQLLDILEGLFDEFPRLAVVVIGEDGAEEVRREAARRRIMHRCIFVGLVPYAEVPKYVNCLDVGVAFESPERMHSVGHAQQKVPQYLACGVPVISGLGGNRFLIGSGFGSVVDPSETEQLLEAARHWMRDVHEVPGTTAGRARSFVTDEFSVRVVTLKRLSGWLGRYTAELGAS